MGRVWEIFRAPSAMPGGSAAGDLVLAYGVRLIWALILGYGLCFAVFADGEPPLPWQPRGFTPNLYDGPLLEDGFYGLTIAWNIARGEGASVNHGLLTTGFQPLATAGIMPLLAKTAQLTGGGKAGFARLMIVFGAINLALLSHLIGLISAKLALRESDRRACYVFGAAAACNFHLFRLCTSGMETGVYLALIAVVALASFELFGGGDGAARSGWRDAVIFGALAGLTGLARIDFGVVFGVVLGLLLLQRRVGLGRALAAGAVALAVVSPWFLWVHDVSGSWMPSSGTVEGKLIDWDHAATRAYVMRQAILQNLAPWFYGYDRRVIRWVGALSLAALGFLWFRNRGLRRPSAHAIAYAWLAGFAALTAVYFVFFWATHFYHRFTAPIMLATIPFLTVYAVPTALSQGRRWIPVGLAALPLTFFAFAVLVFHSGRWPSNFGEAARFVRDHVGPSRKVGAFQSGVIGYVNPNVVNLDGKVNSDALPYLARGAMEEYLDEAGIDVIVDWPIILQSTLDEEYLKAHWRSCEPELNNGFVCFERKAEAEFR